MELDAIIALQQIDWLDSKGAWIYSFLFMCGDYDEDQFDWEQCCDSIIMRADY